MTVIEFLGHDEALLLRMCTPP